MVVLAPGRLDIHAYAPFHVSCAGPALPERQQHREEREGATPAGASGLDAWPAPRGGADIKSRQ